MAHDTVLIVDFGSQVTQLIARRVREQNVYCEIHPYYKLNDVLATVKPKAIILSGSPHSVIDQGPMIDLEIFACGVPILGICYGQQLICKLLGGEVEGSSEREFGRAEIKILENSPLFNNIAQIDDTQTVWMSHGDRVITLPNDFNVIAQSDGAPFAAIENKEKKIYAVQFHPEVVHTSCGSELIKNFLFSISNIEADWSMSSFMDKSIIHIKEKVGKSNVLCGLSGGVDSSVTAILINEAIGDQLTCVFVDTGLLRKGEAEQVVTLFRDRFNIKLIHIDAKHMFISALDGVSDPEQKRKIIGKLFIDIFEHEASKLENIEFLAQGTLYPDIIESISPHGGPSVVIKSHHNVGGLPDKMKLKLLEPLKELFKDEVRALGRELGLDKVFIERHPFPGPGLAIRIPGEITSEKVAILQEADAIFIDEIKKAGIYNEIWQAFSVLLPTKTVGVMGDSRTYENVLALRAVTSLDGMTADFYEFPWHVLQKISSRIVNDVKGINRIVYDVTSKPPSTIEWE